MPLAHPQFPGIKVPGAVTIVIVPDSAEPRPTPSDGLLRTVCAFLETRRLLTTELYAVGPSYVSVGIETQVVTNNAADPARVRQDVETAIRGYLHPLTG